MHFGANGVLIPDSLKLESQGAINAFSVGLKLITVDRAYAEKHYADLSAKLFFSGLVDYIVSGPVVAMVWAARFENVRNCANVIHGSDSVESAKKEIALWFREGVAEWQSSSFHSWIYE
ncbi:hypothetical protein RND71_028540 [Anisodus tanguticus]|uniref:Nucleoside diphosphate kinase n=1 Tax=Anisodus tanguticus TaxID=243964 RepID=A0AAE1RL88_9SOLA|nr:hypothetical protein RND71_028540 [Anisodus tanguticus]